MGKLAEALRVIQKFSRPLGSAAAPPPIELAVPDDLRRAVDEEHRRRAAEADQCHQSVQSDESD